MAARTRLEDAREMRSRAQTTLQVYRRQSGTQIVEHIGKLEADLKAFLGSVPAPNASSGSEEVASAGPGQAADADSNTGFENPVA